MKGLRLLTAILCWNLAVGPTLAAAADTRPGLSLSQDMMPSGTEYVSGNFPGAILMPVNLWGAVGRPGIHHVPTHTDLVTLLSLAGGPMPDAQIDDIVIKRRTGKEEQIIRVDGDDLLRKPGVHSPVLEANDIIIIPRDKPTINPNVVTTITFVGSIVGLILAGFAISNQVKR